MRVNYRRRPGVLLERVSVKERVILKVHRAKVWMDRDDPGLIHYTLEGTFRHVLWECYAYLKAIQMRKKAEGLGPRGQIPMVVY